MKLTMMALAASSLLMTGSALAQDQAVDDRLNNDSQKSVVKAESPKEVSETRAFGTYRMMKSDLGGAKDAKLTGGVQVYNEVTRNVATISGNLTVLAGEQGLAAVAQEFGLAIVSEDSRVGMGLLKAPEGADLTALVEQLRASDLVRAARIEVIEPRNELHVIKR
ncbi:hypothetical protein NJR55_02915 [Idiomarina sp. M1R2S28]|uniref:ASP external chaperone domain-containing protein n=1 Tax=Idiomarina rhizosphaerae TaxID=2961572 RepID=A0A9X2JR75_9GAMM|nr:hypothetical protein [Idiomarina rhizosphaerae]MCP1338533.1 hypothetical protein [Idiomarina rhizosphaerae]